MKRQVTAEGHIVTAVGRLWVILVLLMLADFVF